MALVSLSGKEKFSSDGRGAVTLQLHRREVFHCPSDIPPNVGSGIVKLNDFLKIKVDNIDLFDISPALADLLVRIPGRNYRYSDTYWIARFCGHITVHGNPNGLCEFCIVVNCLTAEFTYHSFHEHKPWIKMHIQEYFPECVEDNSGLKKLTRKFQNKLNGDSQILATDTFLPTPLKDTIRERHMIIHEGQKDCMERLLVSVKELSKGSNEHQKAVEKLGRLTEEFDVMAANLQYLASMKIDTVVQERIDRFLAATGDVFARLEGRTVVSFTKDASKNPSDLLQLHKLNTRRFFSAHKEDSVIDHIPIPKVLKRTSDLSKYYDDLAVTSQQKDVTTDGTDEDPVHLQTVPKNVLDAQRLYWTSDRKKQPGRYLVPYKDQTKTSSKTTVKSQSALEPLKASTSPPNRAPDCFADYRADSPDIQSAISRLEEQPLVVSSVCGPSPSKRPRMETDVYGPSTSTNVVEPESELGLDPASDDSEEISVRTAFDRVRRHYLTSGTFPSGVTESDLQVPKRTNLKFDTLQQKLTKLLHHENISPVEQKEIVTKTLTLPEGQSEYGFSIAGGVDQNIRPYLSTVVEGGVAAKCGLQKDDEVLVVNSKSIDCLRNEKVLGYIRAQSKTGQLKVTVRRYTYKVAKQDTSESDLRSTFHTENQLQRTKSDTDLCQIAGLSRSPRFVRASASQPKAKVDYHEKVKKSQIRCETEALSNEPCDEHKSDDENVLSDERSSDDSMGPNPDWIKKHSSSDNDSLPDVA